MHNTAQSFTTIFNEKTCKQHLKITSEKHVMLPFNMQVVTFGLTFWLLKIIT